MNNNPYNVEIEQVLIGSILNNNNNYDKISDIISADDFYEKTHQEIYKEMKKKLDIGQIADVLTLSNILNALGVPINYLLEISKNIYPSENLKQYAELLLDLSHRRKLINIGKNITDSAINHQLEVKEQILQAENQIFSIRENKTAGNAISFYDGANNILKFTYNVIRNEQSIVGVPSGFRELDNLLGGMRPGELIILAGRPAMGKTAFATNICNHVASLNKSGVLFVSLEMPYEQICLRIVASISSIPLNALLHAKISLNTLKDCIEAMEKFKLLPLYIYDTAFLTVINLRSLIKQMKRQNNIGFVVVDYLQLMESVSKKENREQEISTISRSLKLIAKESGLPILALSQMSRDIEKRTGKPKLSDLRGSGSIEQDADVILFLYREEGQDMNYVRVSVAKNRNGALGDFDLRYYGDITTFKNI
jgi:replicative DNA helicase